MMELPVTSIFAAVFALALVALSVPVTLRRIEVHAPIGPSSDVVLTQRIRAQGNFIEYVPLALIAMGLVEMSGASSWVLLTIGGTLAAGRAFHAIGTLSGSTPLRGAGMIFTYLALVTAAIRLGINSLF